MKVYDVTIIRISQRLISIICPQSNIIYDLVLVGSSELSLFCSDELELAVELAVEVEAEDQCCLLKGGSSVNLQSVKYYFVFPIVTIIIQFPQI